MASKSSDMRDALAKRVEKLEAENRRLRDNIEAEDFEPESLFETLAENVNALIFVYSEGYLTYANRAMAQLLGLSGKELLSQSCRELLGQDVCDLFARLTQKAPSKAVRLGVYDLELNTEKYGKRYYTCSVSFLPGRKSPKILVHAVDYSLGKKFERALQVSEEKYRSLAESAPDIIYTLDLDGMFTYVNPKWKSILGHEPSEVLGKRLKDFAREKDRTDLELFMKRVSERKEAVDVARIKLLTKNGETRSFELSGSPYLNANGAVMGVAGIAKDVTDRDRIEDHLRHAQKMEAIGALAGGIAHDFNNILQSIQSNAQLLLIYEKENESARRRLRAIEDATNRAGQLTKQLLEFGQKAETSFRSVDLNSVVRKVQGLIRGALPQNIRIDLILRKDIQRVYADPAHIEQAIMNLVVNARHAMPEGGVLTIETDSVSLDREFCRSHPGAAPGNFTLLAISDTGHGMDAEVLEHIFEPFYTTREIGGGVGLGLATVYGIVKSHAGSIYCESEPGAGARFSIFIPAIQTESESASVEPAPLESLDKAKGDILLVDDEIALREIGREILEAYGFSVSVVSSGEEALEVLKSGAPKPDIVILDLIMPGMGGHTCLKEMLKLDPHMKVIVASGYAAHGEARDVLREGAMGFINKPYDIAKMMKIVNNVLATPRQG